MFRIILSSLYAALTFIHFFARMLGQKILRISFLCRPVSISNLHRNALVFEFDFQLVVDQWMIAFY